jgi:transposase
MPYIQESEELFDIKINCTEWPVNSPDLKSIENLWAICKDRLRKLSCIAKEKLICAVIRVWFYDPKLKKCKKILDSMPKKG